MNIKISSAASFVILIAMVFAAIMLGFAYGFPDPVSATTPDPDLGFLAGVWHGTIFVISFIFSLFNDDVAVYAANNSGGWYDFGFLLGLSATVSSGK